MKLVVVVVAPENIEMILRIAVELELIRFRLRRPNYSGHLPTHFLFHDLVSL